MNDKTKKQQEECDELWEVGGSMLARFGGLNHNYNLHDLYTYQMSGQPHNDLIEEIKNLL